LAAEVRKPARSEWVLRVPEPSRTYDANAAKTQKRHSASSIEVLYGAGEPRWPNCTLRLRISTPRSGLSEHRLLRSNGAFRALDYNGSIENDTLGWIKYDINRNSPIARFEQFDSINLPRAIRVLCGNQRCR
jgi:hypothetical protein